MAVDYSVAFTNTDGVVFPNTTAINATGPSATDGTEFVKLYVDDAWGFNQALLDWAGLTPTGVTESAAVSQRLEAIQKGHGVGPGKYVWWGLDADPSVTGDRVLLLSKQGVLKASYPDLDAACYVGDPDNGTAAYFYHASDAAGTTRLTTGAYLILPPGKQLYEKQYTESAGDFTLTGPTGWTTTYASAVPYQTADGTWRLKFNFRGTLTAATSASITMSGIAITTNTQQSVSAYIVVGGSPGQSSLDQATTKTNGITITANSNFTIVSISGDVALDSEPTFTDGFNYPLGICY